MPKHSKSNYRLREASHSREIFRVYPTYVDGETQTDDFIATDHQSEQISTNSHTPTTTDLPPTEDSPLETDVIKFANEQLKWFDRIPSSQESSSSEGKCARNAHTIFSQTKTYLQ